MNVRLLTVHDVLGPMIHRRLGRQTRAPVTLTDYRTVHGRVLRPGFVAHRSRLPLIVGVNHGRWVGLCPECRNGVMTDPDWAEARCFDCGAVLDAVVWPEQMALIERELLKRPIQHQNFTPGEALQDLIVQNLEHGILPWRSL